MSLFKRKQREFGGLLLDKGLFRFVSLKGEPGNIQVVQTSFGTLPGGKDEEDPFVDSGARLESMLSYVQSETGALKMPVNVAIPTTDALLRIVPLPDLEPEEAKQAFRYDYERYFPFSADEAIYDLAPIMYPMPGNVEEKRYIVASTRKAMVENLMDAADAQDMYLGAIEPAQLALERAITPKVAPSDAVVYVYAGRKNSVITLSWKGNGIFYRVMSVGFGDKPEVFDPAAATDDAVEYSFAKQVRSSLQFAISQIRGFVPDSMYLFGPGSSEGLCTLLKETVDIANVKTADPLRINGIELNQADVAAGMWDIPVGLAMRFL